jgi:5-methylcytosine-specific restriction enzyme subunit McrC
MSTIPIQNIYYLLSYAWNKLDEKERVKVSIEGGTKLQDLFANVLLNGSKILLKRGINKSYVEYTEEIAGIKGKLLLEPTLKKALQQKQHTICTFDDYSPDILINQILHTSFYRLRHTEGLDAKLKLEIRRLLRYFPEISRIQLSRRDFKKARQTKVNRMYEFVLDVCELLFENSLPSEHPGEWVFMDFTRDESQMNRLYEAFVRRFYQIHLSGRCDVGSTKINWKFEASEAALDFLPGMTTDITIEDEERKVIIDAKFYQETMSVYYNKERIRSGNLYQLFAYLVNQENTSEKSILATGILLYPTVQNEYDLEYEYKGHKIFIKTVNLNMEWWKIEERLREIVKF